MTKSVLFVDDDLSVLQALMRRMRKEPFELRTATSGVEALGILERSPIDLVVSDLNMPGMSGTEFLAQVAKDYPRCVRIMLTGKPSLDVVMNAINNGEVYRFLTKPYDSEKLAALIREALQHADTSPAIALNVSKHAAAKHSRGDSGAAAQPDVVVGAADHGGPSASRSGELLRLSRETIENLANPEFFAQGGGRPRIQQYELEGLIGKGAMGLVLKARDKILDRPVALKIMAPDLTESEIAHERFAQEARYAAAIRHENVVTIFTVSDVAGVPFIIMEFVPGTSLDERMEARHRFSVADIARIGRQVAAGLAAAHDLRLIHRDIKPANILLESNTQRVRITDFGLARAVDGTNNLSQQGVLLGTPLYMSPEQVDGKTLTPATDIFSLGSVLYTLCTGKHPFTGSTIARLLHAIAECEPTPVRKLCPTVPDWLVDLIGQLHAKDPEQRPCAASVAERLGRV